MNRLKPDQKEKVRQFLAFTSSNEKCAIEVLTQHSWNLEVSVDSFFNNPPPSAFENAPSSSSSSFNKSSVQALFDKYAEEEVISYDGMTKFFEDAGIDPDDILSLIVAWQLNAKTFGEFTKEEFVDGFSSLRCDSMGTLKDRLPSIRAQIADDMAFKQFYLYVFEYSKGEEAKALSFDVAVELWKMMKGNEQLKFLDQWLAFVEEMREKKSLRGFGKDTWAMLLEFMRDTKLDLSDYDEAGAWPLIIDEFVDYLKSKKG